jgi:hypothetical protein
VGLSHEGPGVVRRAGQSNVVGEVYSEHEKVFSDHHDYNEGVVG